MEPTMERDAEGYPIMRAPKLTCSIPDGALVTIAGVRVMKNGRTTLRCKPGLETAFRLRVTDDEKEK